MTNANNQSVEPGEPRYIFASLNMYADQYFFRIYHPLTDGNASATAYILPITDLASDSSVLQSYEDAFSHLLSQEVRSTDLDSVDQFRQAVVSKYGGSLSVADSARLHLLSLNTDKLSGIIKIVSVRRDARGGQAEQLVERVAIDDRHGLVGAIRRGIAYAQSQTV